MALFLLKFWNKLYSFSILALFIIITSSLCYGDELLIPGSKFKHLLNKPRNELTPVEIVQCNEDRNDGDNLALDMHMILIERNGKKRVRKFKQYQKYFELDRHSFMYTYYPVSLKGTAFLTYDYDEDEKDDDQWMFLPDLNKIKRIGTVDKTASFMGSDITFGDMSSRKVHNYDIKILKNEVEVRGDKCWLVEIIPNSQEEIDKFGYTRIVTWIVKETFMSVRTVTWLKEGEKIKYYDVEKYKKIDGIYIAMDSTITMKRGDDIIHRTRIIMSNVGYNCDLPESMFYTTQLKKGITKNYWR